MSIFDGNMPYTNLHELNLDWVMKQLKEVSSKTDDIDEQVEKAKEYSENTEEIYNAIKDLFVTPQMYGAKGDGVEDDTNAFAEAIQSNKTVFIPEGKYLIKGTLTIPKRTSIIGVTDRVEWDKNYNIIPEDGIVILFRPNTLSNLFEIDQSDLEVGYVPNITIKNLSIYADNNSCNTALYLNKTSHSIFENIFISKFRNGLVIDYNMLCIFRNVTVHNATQYNIHITDELTTTCRFYDCYVGQNENANAIGLKIDDYSGYQIDFYSLTIETMQKGMLIGNRNTINFYSPYAENIPNSAETGSVIEVVNNDNLLSSSIINITGGTIQGNGQQISTNHYAITVNGYNTITVNGTKFLIFQKVVNMMNNASVYLNSCTEISTTETISATYDNISSGMLSFTNCNSLSIPYNVESKGSIKGVGKTITNIWSTYTVGNKIVPAENYYIVQLSVSAGTGNQIATLPFSVKSMITGRLLDISTVADCIDVYADSSNIYAIGQTAGHVYQGVILIPYSSINDIY